MKRIRYKLKPKIGRGLGQCVHKRKSQYADEASAKAAKLFIWAHDPSVKSIDELHVYTCPICHFLHVGHWDERFQDVVK